MGSKDFVLEVIDLVYKNMEHMSPKSCENLMFFIQRNPLKTSPEVTDGLMKLLEYICDQKFVLKGEIKDHLIMLDLIRKHKLELTENIQIL